MTADRVKQAQALVASGIPDHLTEAQAETLRAVAEHGTLTAAATALDIGRTGMQARVDRALRAADVEPSLAHRLQRGGVSDLAVARSAWLKDKDGDSIFVTFDRKKEEEETLFERLREAFEGMAPAAYVAEPALADGDLLTVYPIADAHIGMLAWGQETGEDYDTKIGTARLVDWVGRCVAASPQSSTGLILDVGDLMHADDQTNMTPRSKHILDVDTRFFRTIEATVAALGTAVELALSKHTKVIVRILPGNHNPHSYLAIMFALAERYRKEPRVEVQKVPGEFFIYQFGATLLAAHHGDKAKPERLILDLADRHSVMWGETRHRYLFTGHKHHLTSQDIGGATWEQLRALTARDAYAVSHAYSARAQLQAITFHKDYGEVERVKVGMR